MWLDLRIKAEDLNKLNKRISGNKRWRPDHKLMWNNCQVWRPVQAEGRQEAHSVTAVDPDGIRLKFSNVPVGALRKPGKPMTMPDKTRSG